MSDGTYENSYVTLLSASSFSIVRNGAPFNSAPPDPFTTTLIEASVSEPSTSTNCAFRVKGTIGEASLTPLFRILA